MKTIRWEKAKKQTPQLPQTAKRGGHLWYGSLLLAAGVFLCVLSAYRQLGQILPGVRILTMPRGTWLLVAAVILAFSVGYNTGWLRKASVCGLSFLVYAGGGLLYYVRHRIALEDGGIYLVRCFLAAVNDYYETQILFWRGTRADAPTALLFWMLVLIGAVCLAVVLGAGILLPAVLPVLVLAAGVAVGRVPEQTELCLLVAGVLLLAMYRSASWQRIRVHLGQLAALACVCAVTGTLFAPLADRAVAEHEYFYERQLAFEDALLALPVAELFAEDGKVTNDAPSGSKQEILTVRLSDKATENVYLRDFAANRYENGKWYADTDGFAELAGQQDMQPDEAGRWLAQYDYANAESLLSSELHTNLLSYSMESPKIYDFTVNYRHWGTAAGVPAVSDLPESLQWSDDAVVQKPWTLREYSGTMVMGGSVDRQLREYLMSYYLTRMFLPYLDGVYLSELPRSGAQEDDEDHWYDVYVRDAYTKGAVSDEAQTQFEDFLQELGYLEPWQGIDYLREAADQYEQQGTVEEINCTRLSYAQIVQQFMQQFGRYDTRLERLPAGADPVDYFLSTSHRGFCVHYASAATLFLQALGIPARYVTGYVAFASDFKKSGTGSEAVVTGERAHAWTEVYLHDIGWLPLEMTPGFDGQEQPAHTDASAGSQNSGTQNTENTSPQTDREDQQNVDTSDVSQDEGTQNVQQEQPLAERKLFGIALRCWLWIALAAAALLLVAFAVQKLYEKWEQYVGRRVEKMLEECAYTQAVRYINRKMYRIIVRGERMRFRRIRDDASYREALMRCSVRRSAAIDPDEYMRIVRVARFSDNGSTAEDVRTAYESYLRCKKKPRWISFTFASDYECDSTR